MMNIKYTEYYVLSNFFSLFIFNWGIIILHIFFFYIKP